MAFIQLDVLNNQPQAKKLEPILGIDLGTTNSLAALWIDSRPVVLKAPGENGIVPSSVYFPEVPGHPPVVGRAARERALVDARNVLFSVKRFMGRGLADLHDDLKSIPFPVSESANRVIQISAQGRAWTPPEISALILREVHAKASLALGTEAPRRCVITVPAYFDDTQRQATRDAARLAELEAVRIVNEPTAASLAYGLDQKKEGFVAVYDLGGGTFDLSILAIEDGVFRVLSTAGDTHLGGDDFDRALMGHALVEIGPTIRAELCADPAFLQALRLAAERCKIQLTTDPEAELHLSVPQHQLHWRRRVSREDFEHASEPLIQRTLDLTRRALADAKLAASAIDEVVLVGGMTRVPIVRRRVEEFFGRRPHVELNPDEVVALGAAAQGHVLAGGTRDILLMDVTPLSLGLETVGGAVTKIILRNSPVPCSVTDTFTTYADQQTGIEFNVVQGERELARDCRSLGRFKLSGLPPMPAGMARVAVRFQVDADGILSVTAKEQSTGTSASIEIRPMHGLTDGDVERMLSESYSHAKEDFEARRAADLRVEMGTMIRAAESHMSEARAHLDKESVQDLEEALARGRAARDAALSAKELQKVRDELERTTLPLAAVLMDFVAKKAVAGKTLDEV